MESPRADLDADGEQVELQDEGEMSSPATTARRDEQNDDEKQSLASNEPAVLDGKPSDDPAAGSEFTLLVILQPDNVRHRVTVTPATTVGMLTESLCSDLRLSADLVSFPDLTPPVGQTYTDIPIAAFGFGGVNNEERTVYAYVARRTERSSDYVMPDRIQVQVYDEESSTYRTIIVEIEKFAGQKPYLGGFRNRKTQEIYHHASSQTFLSRARRSGGSVRSHRDTQTQEQVTRSIQTHRESGTQMARCDLVLDNSCDRVVVAKPYFDSLQLDSLREDSIMMIQRLWRGYRARSYVFNLREQRRRVVAVGELEAQETAIEDANLQRREIDRRMHPKTVNDFEVLYNELEKWRQFETRKLQEDASLPPEQRQEALDGILAKETKLLQTIDRLKLTSTVTNRKQRIESMLQYMSRPKQWQMSDGGVKEVHTPFTIRAKELMDLFNGLNGLKASLSTVDERLDLLLHVKWTVQEFDCALTREIVELVDREADMLSRGRKDKSLEDLHKRLSNLFLQFIENPEFNPEAAALKQYAPK